MNATDFLLPAPRAAPASTPTEVLRVWNPQNLNAELGTSPIQMLRNVLVSHVVVTQKEIDNIDNIL